MIREATLSDIPRLLEWGQAFADRARLCEHVGYEPADMETTFRAMIEAPEHVIFVSETGAIGALSCPHPFNRQTIIAEEMFWWADGGGLRLLSRLREWCRDRNARLIMRTLEAVEPERTGALYRRLGFKPLEHSYIEA